MINAKARVGLVHSPDRRQNVYDTLELVRPDVESKVQDTMMLKPNFLSGTNQLASSHVDAIRGAIDFLLTTPKPPTSIIVAEGGNEKQPGDSFKNFGYGALLQEYSIPIELVDLNQETEWVETPIVLADGSETTVHMPRTVLDCPCTISVAIPKTHDVCVVTLALKNMIMGTIRKIDRIKMHGYHSHAERVLPDEARILNVNLIRLARFLAPDIAIVDGTRGLQGNGPGGEDGVDFGAVAASSDVIAADAVMAKAMGFEPLELGLLYYAHEVGLGIAELDSIDVFGTQIDQIARSFKPHEKTELQMQWQAPTLERYLQA